MSPGLVGRKWETLGKEDQIKGIKVTAAFTAIHSGLVGYFEPDPNDIILQQDAMVMYKGKHAVPVPPGYTSEEDTTDPLIPLTRIMAGRPVAFYGVDQHAQDSRDMLQVEMDDAMAMAIDSQKTTGWLMTYCSSELIGKALTLMVAGKFNWYQTNHHVGQNHATSFIVKIALNTCSFMSTGESAISETAKHTVWEISHWVSTHLCMNLMHMRTWKRVSAHPCGSPIGTAILADDMRIRCDAAPAGMARAALLHAVMKLYHKNMLWLVAPSIDSVLDCAAEYQKFMDDVKVCREIRAVDPCMKNHEGRVYLTGKSDKHRIMNMTVPLGVIGSFLFHKCPSSTMTASPLITVRNRNNRLEPRYQNHHSFSAEFDELCRVTKDKVLEVTKEVKDLIGASDTALAISKADYVNLMRVFNVSPAESELKFDHAAKSLGGKTDGRSFRYKRRDDDSSPERPRRRYRTDSPQLPPSDLEDDPDEPEDEEEHDEPAMDEPEPGPSSGPV